VLPEKELRGDFFSAASFLSTKAAATAISALEDADHLLAICLCNPEVCPTRFLALQGSYPYLSWPSTGQQIPHHAGHRSSIQVIKREQSMHLKMGRLSSMILTIAGPDMSSPSSSTTKLPCWRDPPPATTGAVRTLTGTNTLFQVLRKRKRARTSICVDLLIIPTTTVSHRGRFCHYSRRKRHKMALTVSTTPATGKP
jgi:hypothetical protein